MVNFRKGFDLIDHNLLLHKLSLYKCWYKFPKIDDVIFEKQNSGGICPRNKV